MRQVSGIKQTIHPAFGGRLPLLIKFCIHIGIPGMVTPGEHGPALDFGGTDLGRFSGPSGLDRPRSYDLIATLQPPLT